uniref:uncharacterized protein LOC120328512 isoform X1 n=1 Tax=Styela clava TaxID=7725 RepID=UPI00193A99DB|nr:uncharacterized protein LOC120328512 isoform X1 [Styela clava]
MVSIEEELNNIEQDWEVRYLEETSQDLRYVVELLNKEVSLKVYIPDNYPDTVLRIEFGEKEMKGLDVNMQQNILKSLDQRMMNKIGEPMLKFIVDEIWYQVKVLSAHRQQKNLTQQMTENMKPQKKKKLNRKRAKMAARFGLVGGMQHRPTLANVVQQSVVPVSTKENITKVVKEPVVSNDVKSSSKKNHGEAPDLFVNNDVKNSSKKNHGKAPPMKTARDVINRLKWDEQLKNEEFIVGYEDRFRGILEVPVFDLNWQDDISATGPAVQLTIPEHRVQYFKWNSEVIWKKENRTDFVFGSTGSNIGIVDFMERSKQRLKIASNTSEVEDSDAKNICDDTIDCDADNVQNSTPDEVEIAAKKIVEDLLSGIEKLNIYSSDSADDPKKRSEQNVEIELPVESTDTGTDPGVREVPNGNYHNKHSSRANSSFSYRNERSSREHHEHGPRRSRDRSPDSERRRNERDRSENRNKREGSSRANEPFRCSIFTSRLQKRESNCVWAIQKQMHQHILVPQHLNVNLATCYLTGMELKRLKEVLRDFSKKMRSLKLEFTDATQIDNDIVCQIKRTDSLDEFFEILKEQMQPCQLNIFPHVKIAKIQESFHEDISLLKCSPFTHTLKFVNIGKDFPLNYHQISRNFQQESMHGYSSHKRKMGNEFEQYQYEHPAQKQRLANHWEKDKRWERSISMKLTTILRHNGLGFKIDEDGFLEVNRILSHQFFKNNQVLENDIIKIVNENDKQRFKLEGEKGHLKIRATQGHTVEFSKEEDHLKEITDSSKFPVVVHGTSLELWPVIKDTGLKRMKRNHIHMTTAEPHTSEQVISGMRNSSNCFIYIDIGRAMEDGVKFYCSDNGVILSKGTDGVLLPIYFKEVYGILYGKREILYPLTESIAGPELKKDRSVESKSTSRHRNSRYKE